MACWHFRPRMYLFRPLSILSELYCRSPLQGTTRVGLVSAGHLAECLRRFERQGKQSNNDCFHSFTLLGEQLNDAVSIAERSRIFNQVRACSLKVFFVILWLFQTLTQMAFTSPSETARGDFSANAKREVVCCSCIGGVLSFRDRSIPYRVRLRRMIFRPSICPLGSASCSHLYCLKHRKEGL